LELLGLLLQVAGALPQGVLHDFVGQVAGVAAGEVVLVVGALVAGDLPQRELEPGRQRLPLQPLYVLSDLGDHFHRQQVALAGVAGLGGGFLLAGTADDGAAVVSEGLAGNALLRGHFGVSVESELELHDLLVADELEPGLAFRGAVVGFDGEGVVEGHVVQFGAFEEGVRLILAEPASDQSELVEAVPAAVEHLPVELVVLLAERHAAFEGFHSHFVDAAVAQRFDFVGSWLPRQQIGAHKFAFLAEGAGDALEN
jgi:hypothetical protein